MYFGVPVYAHNTWFVQYKIGRVALVYNRMRKYIGSEIGCVYTWLHIIFHGHAVSNVLRKRYDNKSDLG